IPTNARPPRITAAAGTELAGASFSGTVTSAGYSPSSRSSRSKGVYDPKIFILHAALRRQACAHCEQFPTAASRRSLGRVSVPVWPSALSGRLPIVALVSHYPTNYLIGRGPLIKRRALRSPSLISTCSKAGCYAVLASLSGRYPPLEGRSPTCYSPVRHSVSIATNRVRLACVRHAASVDSEPGSNSHVKRAGRAVAARGRNGGRK